MKFTTTQSRQKFGKKQDASSNVYLMLILQRLRNSWTDLNKQHKV